MYNLKECQAFVDYFLAEHRRLRVLWKGVWNSVTEGKCKSEIEWQGTVLEGLRQFRDNLAHHFAEEEQGGCLDEAVSYCPTLSVAAERVKEEHPQLLTLLDRLIAQAADSGSTIEDRVTLENSLEEFQTSWRTHEAGENELLRRAFGSDTNGEDTQGCAENRDRGSQPR